MQDQKHVNYVYFAIFFFLIAFLHIFQIALINNVSIFDRFFYGLNATGQCLIETAILAMAGNLLLNTCSKWINRSFIVLMFLILLVHIVDAPLIRIMDMTIWYAIDITFAESYSNFIEMLRASNISFTTWILALIAALALPFIGLAIYRLTDKISVKKPLYISYSKTSMSLLSITLFITVFDFQTYREVAPDDNGKFVKALPWKSILFTQPQPSIKLDKSLAQKPSEQDHLVRLSSLDLKAAKKPNIFLFVVESLRSDFITEQVAPHLTRFRGECGKFENAISAANATQFSWFSIYHSVYPFYWDKRQPQNWQSGSLPLQILKKIGYKIHLISSAKLEYYKMNEILFGKDHYLADTFDVFSDEPMAVHQKDAACFDTLFKNLENGSEGNVFLVFLDSTHFDYSWPEESALIPGTEEMDFLKVACATGVEGIKDRYRNAIHYVDGLMGQFFEKLAAMPSGNDAVVVLTGDHGEEFLEQGNIFHASNLSSMQTRVPIFCRLGTTAPADQLVASHLDIFPTILHHVLGEDLFSSWFDGESLLTPNKKNFALASRYNASRNPFEFLIHNGKEQLIVRFDNEKDVSKAKALDLITLRDEHNRLIEIDAALVEQKFQPIFKELFK